MLYDIINIEKKDEDSTILKKYPKDGMYIRMGLYGSMYALFGSNNFNKYNYKKIIKFIKSGFPKYEVIMKNDLTKFYLDCEKIIKNYINDDNYINDIYMLFNEILKEFLLENDFGNNSKIVYLDSSRIIAENTLKLSIHVIINNSNKIFRTRKALLNIVKKLKEKCDKYELLENFVDIEPYKEDMQLIRTIYSINDKDKINIPITPLYIDNYLIRNYKEDYVEKYLHEFLIKLYNININDYIIIDEDKIPKTKLLNSTKNVEEEEEEFSIKIPKRVIDFVENYFKNDFRIRVIRKNRIELSRINTYSCITCNREHESNGAYLKIFNGYLFYYCYSDKIEKRKKCIYNIYEDIDNLWKNNSSSYHSTLSQSERLLSYNKLNIKDNKDENNYSYVVDIVKKSINIDNLYNIINENCKDVT